MFSLMQVSIFCCMKHLLDLNNWLDEALISPIQAN